MESRLTRICSKNTHCRHSNRREVAKHLVIIPSSCPVILLEIYVAYLAPSSIPIAFLKHHNSIWQQRTIDSPWYASRRSANQSRTWTRRLLLDLSQYLIKQSNRADGTYDWVSAAHSSWTAVYQLQERLQGRSNQSRIHMSSRSA